VHLPVLAFPLSLALMLVVCRQLGLGFSATLLAMLATAFFPFNQPLYGVGNIDHHFAEHMVVLASLACGIAWLRKPESRRRAWAAGLLRGAAPCIHNALFILQLPLIATLALMWVRGRPLPATTRAFAAALVIATVAVAAPSAALRLGKFEFFTLSWFHVYFAACVAVACVLFLRLAPSRRNIGILVATFVAMAVPVAAQIILAGRFVSGTVEGMERISEALSVWEMATEGYGLRFVSVSYTALLFLAPVVLGLAVWRLARDVEPHRWLLWIASIIGLAMLATQMRMHYFGSFALYLPWIVWLDDLANRKGLNPRLSFAAFAALAGLFAAAYFPSMPTLFGPKVVANDPYYDATQDIYPAFADACAAAPGVALVVPDDGNYVRYHTRCSVIANGFLLTQQHEMKVREVRRLMGLSATQLLESAPQIRYVFARRGSLFHVLPSGGMQFFPDGHPASPDQRLVRELLTADQDRLPARYRLLKELRIEGISRAPYARLFAIDPAL
jgi:hypothetical protein